MKASAIVARIATGLGAVLASSMALAADSEPVRWQLNMPEGVTQTSQNAYDMHMLMLYICVAIGIVVFGAMGYAMFKFRKSKGAVAAQFSHNTTAEIIWTAVPVLILIGLAWPATHNLIRMYDTRNAEMTVKVTGYQWMWKYEYLGEDVSFTSRLDRQHDALRQSGKVVTEGDAPHYLLNVDNMLVLPVGTKVRFVLTADDVIHAWWVPALGWKQDAIPGLINEAWTEIKEPGTYRGVCAELCGKDHGFMPIVVKAVPKAEFEQWLAGQEAAAAAEKAGATAQAAPPPQPAAQG